MQKCPYYIIRRVLLMKIVAINGSPRKDGNNAQLLEVVRKEVEADGV